MFLVAKKILSLLSVILSYRSQTLEAQFSVSLSFNKLKRHFSALPRSLSNWSNSVFRAKRKRNALVEKWKKETKITNGSGHRKTY